ncbi:MAG: hypothetical protein AB7S36_10810 [Planctomycetota bacterium]
MRRRTRRTRRIDLLTPGACLVLLALPLLPWPTQPSQVVAQDAPPDHPARVEVWTATLEQLDGETADETTFREQFNAAVRSIGGEIPKDATDAGAIRRVLTAPAAWLAASESLQAARNTINRGRFRLMTERPIDNLARVLNEARFSLLAAPRGGPFIALEFGFKDIHSGTIYDDPAQYPIMMKAMQLVAGGKFSDALDTYGFANFPRELVREADRGVYDRKVFAAFRGNIIYAIFWQLIGEDIELEFKRGRLGVAIEYTSEMYLEKMDQELFRELKTKTTDTRMDGNSKVRAAATELQKLVLGRVDALYTELIGEIDAPLDRATSGVDVPLTNAQIDTLEKRAGEIVETIVGWNIAARSEAARARLHDKWKPAFSKLRARARE